MGTTTTVPTESEPRLASSEQGAIRGPWKFLPGKFNNPESTGGPGSIVTDEDDPWYIASIEDAPRSDANGRLIAAAPDMLAALKPLGFCDPQRPPHGVKVEDWSAAVEAARRAVAKAIGRAP